MLMQDQESRHLATSGLSQDKMKRTRASAPLCWSMKILTIVTDFWALAFPASVGSITCAIYTKEFLLRLLCEVQLWGGRSEAGEGKRSR